VFTPYAEITIGANKQTRWFANSAIETIEVTPGAQGTIVIHNPYYWIYHEIGEEPHWYGTKTVDERSYGGPVEASVTATVSVDKDGKVVIGPPLKNGSVGIPGILDGSVESVKQDGQDEGSINISTVLKSPKATSTSLEAAPGKTTGTSSGTGVWMTTYGLVFKVKRKPPTPPTAVTAKISYNKEGKFVSGDEGIDGVNAWWGRIPEPVRRQIMRGTKEVLMHGSASKTGTSTANATVVGNRLKDVRKKLLGLTEGMKILADNLGAGANERCVIIEVRYSADEATAITP
jgi:hypothetical protein